MHVTPCGLRPPRWVSPEVPELPEVQAIADFLHSRLAGSRVARLELASLAALKTVAPPLGDLEGSRIESVSRRGKYLLVATDDASLVLHLARAGWLRWRDDPPRDAARPGRGPLALRLVAVDSDGEVVGGFDVTEAGTKKGLAIYAVRDPLEVPGIARLGPEPLDDSFSADALAAILADAGAAQVKGVLRDQSRIAGIGNAYSDEILHAARISPFAAAHSVDPRALHAALRSVLEQACDEARDQDIARLKAEKRAAMRVHGRTGEPCPACGDVVREVAFADRSLNYCATCQTGGRALADRRMSRLLR